MKATSLSVVANIQCWGARHRPARRKGSSAARHRPARREGPTTARNRPAGQPPRFAARNPFSAFKALYALPARPFALAGSTFGYTGIRRKNADGYPQEGSKEMAHKPPAECLYQGSCLEPTARVSFVGESWMATPEYLLTVDYYSNITIIIIHKQQAERPRGTPANSPLGAVRWRPPRAPYAFALCARRKSWGGKKGLWGAAGCRGGAQQGFQQGVSSYTRLDQPSAEPELSLPVCIIMEYLEVMGR